MIWSNKTAYRAMSVDISRIYKPARERLFSLFSSFHLFSPDDLISSKTSCLTNVQN